ARGGIWGRTVGCCLMIGESTAAVRHCEPIFKTLAPPEGYAHVGPAGAGHYVKMVHNGIEYGMLQAYAEGYEILHASKDFKLNLCNIANLWNHGSVVRSWLNELAARAFEKDADLTTIKGFVEDSGEGRWTERRSDAPRRPGARDHAVPVDPFPVAAGGVVRRQGDRGAP